jgi:hypothetical protein
MSLETLKALQLPLSPCVNFTSLLQGTCAAAHSRLRRPSRSTALFPLSYIYLQNPRQLPHPLFGSATNTTSPSHPHHATNLRTHRGIAIAQLILQHGRECTTREAPQVSKHFHRKLSVPMLTAQVRPHQHFRSCRRQSTLFATLHSALQHLHSPLRILQSGSQARVANRSRQTSRSSTRRTGSLLEISKLRILWCRGSSD